MTNKIDHIIYTCRMLEEGMDRIEKLLGIRPALGGKHPKWGTHNAILSLGDSYLEVVAPDPSLKRPKNGTWIDQFLDQGPSLSSWVLQTTDIEQLHVIGKKADIPFGKIESGQRQKPDGTLLKWKLTDPYVMPYDGKLPFLIDWGTTPHPSSSAPLAGQLKDLVIIHSSAKALNKDLNTLGMNLQVNVAPQPQLKAIIETPKGIIELS